MMKQNMGDLIAGLRKERGMTQKDLAEQMNVTDKAVSKWERNLSCPDVNSIPRLAQVLGVGVEELMTAAPKQEEKPEPDLVKLILTAVPLAMGVAVVALNILGQLDVQSGMGMLGVGMFCLGAQQLIQNKK